MTAVRMLFAPAVLLIPVLTISAEPVVVSQPWARASILASRPAAVYLALESPTGDRLTGIATPVADQAMVHAVEEANGVSRMVHRHVLELPAGQRVTLAPGGEHIMLIGLDAKLVEGETFPLTLTFERAGAVTVDVPVLGIAAQGHREPPR